MPRRRQRHLHVMLSDGEAASLERICEASGSTPSEAVRTMLVASDAAMGDPDSVPVVVLDRASYARHVRCVRGLGTLVNQATRSLNALAKAVREHGTEDHGWELSEALRDCARELSAIGTGIDEVRHSEAAIMGRPSVRGW